MAQCAWREEKGVAVVTTLQEGEARFRFFPGDVAISTRAKPGVAIGQEFKAVVRYPLNGPCSEPQMTVMEPLPADAPTLP